MAASYRTFYGTWRWKQTRSRVLARDGYRCQIAAPGCLVRATEADHIVPVSAGGERFDEANLRAACHPCNLGRRQARTTPSQDWW